MDSEAVGAGVEIGEEKPGGAAKEMKGNERK